MARLVDNTILAHCRGRIGDCFIRQTSNGPVICMRPDRSNHKPSERQKRTNEKFKEAAHYAKYAVKHPELLAIYKKKAKPGQSAYNVAVKAFFAGTHIPLPGSEN